MIMTNSHSIQDVLFFPQMRPEVVEVKKETVQLKPEEIKILEEVKKQNTATVASVSEGTAISKNQTQKILNSLEERNLVKREGPLYQSIN
jgi:lysyl-tRNA synthetase class 2